MQITTHTRHFDLTDSIRDYVESHTTPAITKYFANPETADITFSKNGSLFDVEIKCIWRKNGCGGAGQCP